MTDLQILQQIEAQLCIEFKEVDIEDILIHDSKAAKYSIDKQNKISGLKIYNTKIDNSTLIAKLFYINRLFLYNNQIKDISFLKKFNNITQIRFDSNKISDISVLKNLKYIKLLTLNDNQITDISPIKHLLKKDDFYYKLENNPLKYPPKEIVELGTDAINEYFEHAKQGTTILREAKLIIIGEAGAGKTTFAKKLQNSNAEMPKPSDTTLGIEVFKYQFKFKNQNDFNIKLWDFGGQDIYHGTHQFFFSNKSLYVLLADTREQKTDFAYWLNTVEQLTNVDSPLIIIFNKKEKHIWQLDDEYGYKRRFGNIFREIINVNLSDSAEIPEMQSKIQKEIASLPQIGYILPKSWVSIRRELNNIKEKFISFEKFREICRQNQVTSPKVIKTISKLFANIGVFTHFVEEETNLKDIIFLDSNWLTKTVYSLLNSEIVKNNYGKITRSEINDILETDELFFEIDKFVELLKKFSLVYRINGSQNYIVPVHLKKGQPYPKWKYEDENDIYQFRYLFDNYMPKGIMSRLIIALHQYVYDNELVWQRGVNIVNSISKPDTYAEIIETYGGVNRFDIKISGKNQKDLLNTIIYHFDRILKPFTKLTHEKLVPCNCDTCKTNKNPYFFKYTTLLKAKSKGKKNIECQESFENTDVNELLFGIDFSKLRSILINEKFDEFKDLISRKFTDISYQIHPKGKVSEVFFHSNFHTILAENGLNPISEESTNDGRIDLHLTIGQTKYLFELKKDETAKKALEQIRTKKYYQKFQNNFKKIILIGINFSSKKRNIDEIRSSTYL